MSSNASADPNAVTPDWFIIGWMTVLHAIAFVGPFYYTSLGGIMAAVVLYYVTGMLGITLGYHRLLTHRAFKAPRWVERVLATCGVLALQRSPMEWVGHHRMHHAGVDTDDDPHDASRGFWWSHIGWMFFDTEKFQDTTKLRRFSRDITRDPYLDFLSRHTVQIGLQVALGLALLAVGGWSWVIWGIFVRTVVTYHVTWFVNSATHKWGYRNYETDDLSTNCWWVGILAFGEGWHNNHHAHADVAPAGRKWWEFDLTWQVIKLMKVFGLAYDIKMPPEPARVRFEAPDPAAAAGSGDRVPAKREAETA